MKSDLGRQAEQPIRLRFKRLVALARAVPQSLQIEHADVSPVADQAGLLQGIGHDRDARSPHPQHLPEKFLRERDIFAVQQVAAAQQPARRARLERVGGVAGRGLLGLRQDELLVTRELARKGSLCAAKARKCSTSRAEARPATCTMALFREIWLSNAASDAISHL